MYLVYTNSYGTLYMKLLKKSFGSINKIKITIFNVYLFRKRLL